MLVLEKIRQHLEQDMRAGTHLAGGLKVARRSFSNNGGRRGEDNIRRSKKANGREYRGKTWDEMPINIIGASPQ
jgi:hypothetical protein